MLSYGFSIRGKAHIAAGVVCQDANSYGEVAPGLYIAIAADGVGSALHSDIASAMAVEKLEEYVRQNISQRSSSEERKSCLKAGFRYAEKCIEAYVQDCGEQMKDYDTTLHAVLYDGKRVVYGHAGDGGILVRTNQGRTYELTSPQKGPDGVSVMPLRAGDSSWEFGDYHEEVAAVMLVTDGMLEQVIMPHLLNLPANREEIQATYRHKDHVYLSATEFFMNPYSVMGNRRLDDPLGVYQYFLAGEFQEPEKAWQGYLSCLKSGYRNLYGSKKAEEIIQTLTASVPLWNIEDTTDDKTVVCLINEGASVYKPPVSYFMEPDWVRLRKHYESLLYPAETDMVQEETVSEEEMTQKRKGLFFKKR